MRVPVAAEEALQLQGPPVALVPDEQHAALGVLDQADPAEDEGPEHHVADVGLGGEHLPEAGPGHPDHLPPARADPPGDQDLPVVEQVQLACELLGPVGGDDLDLAVRAQRHRVEDLDAAGAQDVEVDRTLPALEDQVPLGVRLLDPEGGGPLQLVVAELGEREALVALQRGGGGAVRGVAGGGGFAHARAYDHRLLTPRAPPAEATAKLLGRPLPHPPAAAGLRGAASPGPGRSGAALRLITKQTKREKRAKPRAETWPPPPAPAGFAFFLVFGTPEQPLSTHAAASERGFGGRWSQVVQMSPLSSL